MFALVTTSPISDEASPSYDKFSDIDEIPTMFTATDKFHSMLGNETWSKNISVLGVRLIDELRKGISD